MKSHGKKYRAALEKIEPGRKYNLETAIAKVKEIAFAKFDETVELTVWLGVDPRKADQLVRGTIVLPHGLGKSKTVLVIAQGDKVREAEEAGRVSVEELRERPLIAGQEFLDQSSIVHGHWLLDAMARTNPSIVN